MQLISLKKVSKTYGHKRALHIHELNLTKGMKLGIAGETGSGKSTLLRVICGLLKPEAGKVLYKGESVYPKLDRLIPGHPEMAYLSQSFALPRFITVADFLEGNTLTAPDVIPVAEMCSIGDLKSKNTQQLSGGEKQRVALAKVLLKEPDVLLLDEPYSSLDTHHKQIMKHVIEAVSEQTKVTIILVSHHPGDLLPWADDILVLREGVIQQSGTPETIYFNPLDGYVAGLFGAYQELTIDSLAIQNRIVRPEQWQLVNDRNEGNRGSVIKVAFYGSHDLLSVSIKDTIFYAHAPVGRYKENEEVGVKLMDHSME